MKKLHSILLIEDDKITNFINERLIRRMNLSGEILISMNGLKAIEYLRNQAANRKPFPDLIFLDINMPVMDGFEFLERYHMLDYPKKDKTIIIMLTTSTHIKDMDKLLNAGNTDYLSKPLTEGKLMHIMDKYFHAHQLGQIA